MLMKLIVSVLAKLREPLHTRLGVDPENVTCMAALLFATQTVRDRLNGHTDHQGGRTA